MEEKENYEDETPIIEDDETGEPLEIEEPDNSDDSDEDEDDSDDNYSLGECRIHPPTPLNLFRGGKGNKAEVVTSQTLLGDKAVYVYEFPPCVGMECEAYWCSTHEICSFACRHEAECHSAPVESGGDA